MLLRVPTGVRIEQAGVKRRIEKRRSKRWVKRQRSTIIDLELMPKKLKLLSSYRKK